MELTQEQLKEKERKPQTRGSMTLDFLVCLLPPLCGGIALWLYLALPDFGSAPNRSPATYIWFLGILVGAYAVTLAISLLVKKKGLYQKIRHKAPLYAAVFLLFAVYDYLTLKTNTLLYPFFPWVNDILNTMIGDWRYLLDCSLNTLKLLFCGYFSGAAAGLVTGIVCGYSKKVRYWVDPLIKILGPIPTATWIPLVMVVASTLFRGSVFIVALGVWFSVTVASMTGIAGVDKAYFEAGQNMGCNSRQLVFRIAIPCAIPNIIQGLTQGMSSACTALMIAEMIGVESGLGWYIIWAKAWASYNKMYAAIVIICIIFTLVTWALSRIKKYVLRWQQGMVR